jgi:CRP-like cAMP-binding protein
MQSGSTVERRGYLELPLRRLQALSALSDVEHAAVRGLQASRQKWAKGESLTARGAGPHLVLDGWGCQVRELPRRRQIFAFVLPGDVIGVLPGGSAEPPPFDHRALTPMTLIDASALGALSSDGKAQFPGVQAALAAFRARARARFFDHLVRLGGHTGYESLAHLLLELHDRLTEIGQAENGRFAFPIGQERLGEALGLSSMHVHRTLAKLKQDGHLLAGQGWFTLPRWRELAQVVDYAPSHAAPATSSK